MRIIQKSPAPASKLGKRNNKPSYNNSLNNQRQRLLAWIKKEAISTFQARAYGIPHPAGRINELRQLGHKIILNWINEADENGIEHRIGQYIYLGEEKHHVI